MLKLTWLHPSRVAAVGRFHEERQDAIVAELRGGRTIIVAANGHYRIIGSEKEGELVYVVRTDAGHELTLSPAEMEQRYGWKNDPDKVSLIASPNAGK